MYEKAYNKFISCIIYIDLVGKDGKRYEKIYYMGINIFYNF